jgi:acetyltransferase-like isoleucine patch superfamily enzyme
VEIILYLKEKVLDMGNQAYDLTWARIGQDVTIWEHSKIINTNVISIGDSVIIDDFVFIMGGSKTEIGSFVHIASFTSITGGGEFIMEDFSGVSGGVKIYTGNEDYLGGCLTNPTVPYPYRIATRSFVHIKKHAIIGANTVVLPGVVIGEGAAIGANSLVTKDCEPWKVYFGSPAKAIKNRTKDKIIALEARLKQEIYDPSGKYIPIAKRESTVKND